MEIAWLRSVILGSFPELERARFRRLAEGWHSVAVEADDGLIFKFPKGDAAEAALVREAGLLAVVRPRVTLPVPAMRLHRGPPTFSSHRKLEGGQLLTADYLVLPEPARDLLGRDLGRFYAELHALGHQEMAAAGARAIAAWQTPETVRRAALPLLPAALGAWAEATVAAFERLPPDPHGQTYGFFDGHGWNMAFDAERGRLNGIYDFADSGFGPLHQDFVYSNLIAPDLTERIVAAYEGLTGRRLDRRRIRVLTGFHRLSELAEAADEAEQLPMMLRQVADWAAVMEAAEGERGA